MVGINDSANKNQKFYNSTVHAILRGGIYYATEVGDICDRFACMGDPVKTQVEYGIIKLFKFRGQTIDVSDQSVFT